MRTTRSDGLSSFGDAHDRVDLLFASWYTHTCARRSSRRKHLRFATQALRICANAYLVNAIEVWRAACPRVDLYASFYDNGIAAAGPDNRAITPNVQPVWGRFISLD